MYLPEAGSEEKIPKRKAKNDPQFAKSDMIGAGTRYGKQLSSLTVQTRLGDALKKETNASVSSRICSEVQTRGQMNWKA